jgi:FkbM family methyltransferase
MSKLLLELVSWISRIIPSRVKQGLYRLGPITRLIRGTLNRAAPLGYTRVTVAGGALSGIVLNLDLQSEKDYWLGTYEADLQAALADFAKEGMVAYDLGANIGYITLMLARAVGPKGHVFAFEALPTNIRRLRKHLELNNIEPRVTPVHGAVVGTPGQVEFLRGPSGATGKVSGAAGREIQTADRLLVDGIVLDDYVYRQGHPPPDLIKMDIEGGEIQALPGMKQVLLQARPVLLMELHGPQSAQAAWQALSDANYHIQQMSFGSPQVESWEELDWKAYLVARPGDKH